jgi:hypothetical protein
MVAKVRIGTTKEGAKKQHDEVQAHPDSMTMTIYIDGSVIEGKIGAAAYNAATNEASHQHPGSEARFNMYTTELTAVPTSNNRTTAETCEYRICSIYIDSQTTNYLRNCTYFSGNHLLRINGILFPSFEELYSRYLGNYMYFSGNQFPIHRYTDTQKEISLHPEFEVLFELYYTSERSIFSSCRQVQFFMIQALIVKNIFSQ